MSEKESDEVERLSLETRLAGLHQPALDRSTIWPYQAGEIGDFAYQRYDHPLASEVERVLGELEGGRALLFSCGMAAVAGIVLTFCKPGDAVAVPLGAYVSTGHLISDQLSRFDLRLVEFDQTGPPPARQLWSGSSPARTRCSASPTWTTRSPELTKRGRGSRSMRRC